MNSMRRTSCKWLLIGLLNVSLSGMAFADPPDTTDPAAADPAAEPEPPVDEAPPADAEPLTPRQSYNAGLEKFDAGELDRAEGAFLEARQKGGQDHEVRFRAAFNLGMTYAARADAFGIAGQLQPEDAEKAMAALRQSADAFRDAIRLKSDDEDARVNLEVVLMRIQVLANLLNKEGGLEEKLDRLIEDQRSLRESVRALTNTVATAGDTTDPEGFREDFRGLSGQERTLLSDANGLAELVGAELGGLEGKKDEEKTDEDKVRIVQLKNLTHYLDQGRGAMADTRQLLRKLQGEAGHRKADYVLRQLKRAREQLADPLAALKSAIADQTQLMKQTAGLEGLRNAPISASPGAEPPPQAPAWLTEAFLSETQGDIKERNAELLMRLQAGTQSPQDPAAPPDPDKARLLQSATEAIPLLQTADQAMSDTVDRLTESKLSEASQKELEALVALSQAMERFADIKSLIEIAYSEQQQVVALLKLDDPAQQPLSAEDREQTLNDAAGRNIERLTRLEGFFADELAKLDDPQPGPDGQPVPQEQTDREKQRYQQAEQLRRRALAATFQMKMAMDELKAAEAAANVPSLLGVDATQPVAPTQPADATQPIEPTQPVAPTQPAPAVAPVGPRPDPQKVVQAAQNAEEAIGDLRLLFLSAVEHLEELAKRQANTLDKSSSVAATYPKNDDPDKEAELEGERMLAAGPLSGEQSEHADVADALTEAFRAQADAISQQPAQPGMGGQGGQAPQQQADALAAAADEITAASSSMRSATGALSQTPLDLSGTIEHQQAALNHLQKALEILQPPPPPQENKAQQDEKQQQDEISKEQAERKLQEVRDREAERRKNKEQKGPEEIVEKDW
ncbi:MAG: hypothetical protein AUK47_14950 [Deltaproteobacteria bacterium CG2_30_63_29]|nr:MAG: hypothetical protein AUK47_14950 [Deltaproteobacteria bacterium CG2_30_63_29]PJB43059.1 MAG: hypothetical protein CO108_10625 [Deltaproteobacteria bacterium CG_4_9_14_3_um_filter_63_12]